MNDDSPTFRLKKAPRRNEGGNFFLNDNAVAAVVVADNDADRHHDMAEAVVAAADNNVVRRHDNAAVAVAGNGADVPIPRGRDVRFRFRVREYVYL